MDAKAKQHNGHTNKSESAANQRTLRWWSTVLPADALPESVGAPATATRQHRQHVRRQQRGADLRPGRTPGLRVPRLRRQPFGRERSPSRVQKGRGDKRGPAQRRRPAGSQRRKRGAKRPEDPGPEDGDDRRGSPAKSSGPTVHATLEHALQVAHGYERCIFMPLARKTQFYALVR